MALVKTENIHAPIQGFKTLSAYRQVGLMAGLAISIAIGASIILWSQSPNYRVLAGNLSESDLVEISTTLERFSIPYRISGTGFISVPANDVQEARLKLAAEGLPESSGSGFEILDQSDGFGASQFMEQSRYQRALSGELARTITAISGIQNARVHLALSKQSVFVRDRKKPTASVLVHLKSGKTLSETQITSITHLVASSVPNLEPDEVTVVDQRGHLLSRKPHSEDLELNATQFAYRLKLEKNYIRRIQDLLTPIVGPDGVRAQVVANLNFTVTEQTEESYLPQENAIRSEVIHEESSEGSTLQNGGIPGALSNRPPQDGTTDGGENTGTPKSSVRNATRNYEINKTISHTKLASGDIKRLSVAVVVDDKQTINEAGAVVRTPVSPEEIVRMTGLVKEAIGFDEARGDTVNVMHAPFTAQGEFIDTPEETLPVWQQPWMWDITKKVLGGIGVLLLLLGVLRPVLRDLASKSPPQALLENQSQAAGELAASIPGISDQVIDLPQQSGIHHAGMTDKKIGVAKDLVSKDPRVVAEVVKDWVAKDG